MCLNTRTVLSQIPESCVSNYHGGSYMRNMFFVFIISVNESDLSVFPNKFNKFNNTSARMLDKTIFQVISIYLKSGKQCGS